MNVEGSKSKPLEACKFSLNEIVLCYEPDPMKAKMLYDAKILDSDVTKDEKGKKVFEYYIHFQGWNKSWDRWILENKILKANEINRTLQTKLYDEAIRQKKRKPKSCKHDSGDEKDDKSVTSLCSGNSDDIKPTQIPSVSLDIPKILAVRLEDDCYNIKRRKKLVHLPRKPTVNEIFNEYYSHCEKVIKTPEGRNLSLRCIYEMVHGLNTYFNYFLFSLLLYNFEREQYHNFFPEEQKPLPDGLSPIAPITPKLVSPNSVGFSDSSRSNSRTSSFCEDAFSIASAPLLKEVFKPKTIRKRKGEGKARSVDGSSSSSIKRKKSNMSSSTTTNMSQNQITCESDGKILNRETRSARKTVPEKDKYRDVYPKEEKAIKPMEILAENIIDMERTVTRSKVYAHKDLGGSKESSSTSRKNMKEANENKGISKKENDNQNVKESKETTKVDATDDITSKNTADKVMGNKEVVIEDTKEDVDKDMTNKIVVLKNKGVVDETVQCKDIVHDNVNKDIIVKDETGCVSDKDILPKDINDSNLNGNRLPHIPCSDPIDKIDEKGKEENTIKETLSVPKIPQSKEMIETLTPMQIEIDGCTMNQRNDLLAPNVSLHDPKDDKENVDHTEGSFDSALLTSVDSQDNRLRRSMRPPKFPNTSEGDELETLPMGSTAKSLLESYKGPLKLSTDNPNSDIILDKTYMVYPVTSSGDTPADIYGLEHLLRLFVKLPVLLATSHMEERKMSVILKYVSQFIDYLSKRTDLFIDSTLIYSESII